MITGISKFCWMISLTLRHAGNLDGIDRFDDILRQNAGHCSGRSCFNGRDGNDICLGHAGARNDKGKKQDAHDQVHGCSGKQRCQALPFVGARQPAGSFRIVLALKPHKRAERDQVQREISAAQCEQFEKLGRVAKTELLGFDLEEACRPENAPFRGSEAEH